MFWVSTSVKISKCQVLVCPRQGVGGDYFFRFCGMLDLPKLDSRETGTPGSGGDVYSQGCAQIYTGFDPVDREVLSGLCMC